MPVRLTYKIALKISRRSWLGARPPTPASARARRQPVSCGAISAQRASDRPDGYARRSVMTSGYGDFRTCRGPRVRGYRHKGERDAIEGPHRLGYTGMTTSITALSGGVRQVSATPRAWQNS